MANISDKEKAKIIEVIQATIKTKKLRENEKDVFREYESYLHGVYDLMNILDLGHVWIEAGKTKQ